MLHLLLPVSYALSLAGFTAMRKAGLAIYLKPHQITIALAAFFTIFAFILSELKLISLAAGDGYFDSLVLWIQHFFLLAALLVRGEVENGDFAMLLSIVSVISLICLINASECERYSNFVLGLIGFALILGAVSRFNAGVRDRKLWLFAVWGLFSTCTSFACAPLTPVYAVTGLGAMLVVKLAHPLLGDKFEHEYAPVAVGVESRA